MARRGVAIDHKLLKFMSVGAYNEGRKFVMCTENEAERSETAEYCVV